MENITVLGHEPGYHYEDPDIAKGDLSKAMAHFEARLAQFRHIYPVTTIRMARRSAVPARQPGSVENI